VSDGTGDPSPTERPLLATTINLVTTSVPDEEAIQPLAFADLPAAEQRILRTAADEGYEVRYAREEGIPDTEETEGLRSLIDRFLDRLNAQKAAYREAHDDLPDYVDAVYLRQEGALYCLDIVDGDQKYYHC